MTKDTKGVWRTENNTAIDAKEKPWSATNGYWECHFRDGWEALFWIAHMQMMEEE